MAEERAREGGPLVQQNNGSDAYRLFVDTIEETRARGAFPGRKRRGIGRPKHLITDIEARAMKMWEQMRRRYERMMQKAEPNWVPDEAYVRGLQACSSEIVKLSNSIRLGRKAEAEARAGLTDEQLDAVAITELRRAATRMSEEDWRVLLSVGLGVDIAEAAIAVVRMRAEEAAAKSAPTQAGPGGVLPTAKP